MVHALVRTPGKGAFLENLGVRLFPGDLSDKAALETAMEGCDLLFHMAAYAKVWAKDPALYFDVNVLGTERVLEAALADLRAKDFIIRHGMDIVFLCPTRVFGPYPIGEPASVTGLIHRYVQSGWRIIPGSGRQLGNYVFVEDVADAHILAAVKGENGRSYIIGGENCSYNRFFELIREASGIRRRMIHLPLFIQRAFTWIQLAAALLFGAEPELTPSWMASRRAEEELGYRPTPLKEGIERTVRWSRRPSL